MAATNAYFDHLLTEERYVTFGVSEKDRLVVVSHISYFSSIIRIIFGETDADAPASYPQPALLPAVTNFGLTLSFLSVLTLMIFFRRVHRKQDEA